MCRWERWPSSQNTVVLSLKLCESRVKSHKWKKSHGSEFYFSDIVPLRPCAEGLSWVVFIRTILWIRLTSVITCGWKQCDHVLLKMHQTVDLCVQSDKSRTLHTAMKCCCQVTAPYFSIESVKV